MKKYIILLLTFFIVFKTYGSNKRNVIDYFNKLHGYAFKLIKKQNTWFLKLRNGKVINKNRNPYASTIHLQKNFFVVANNINDYDHDTIVVQQMNFSYKKILAVNRKTRIKDNTNHLLRIYLIKNHRLINITRYALPRLTYRNFLKPGFRKLKLWKIRKYLRYIKVFFSLAMGMKYIRASLYTLKMEQMAGFKIYRIPHIKPGATKEQKEIMTRLSRYLHYELEFKFHQATNKFVFSRIVPRPKFER